MFEVRKRMCATCIYGPNREQATRRSIAELEREVADPKMQGFFSGYRQCHDLPEGSTACCRGFWQRHKDHFTLGQIAQRLKLVRFINAKDD